MTTAWLVFALWLLFVVLLIAALSLWAWRGVFLLMRGHYPAARRVFEKQSSSRQPAVRDAARYNVGLCLLHENRLDEAAVHLEALASAPVAPHLHALVGGLLGSTLLLLERDPARAIVLLGQGGQVVLERTTLLERAYASLLLGDQAGAQDYLRRAEAIAAPKRWRLGKVIVLATARNVAIMEHGLRGMLAERWGDAERAVREYHLALAAGDHGIYAQRAREGLARLGAHTNDEPPPPSLRPVVRE